MGSSGGSSPKAPKMTPPPEGMIAPHGSTSDFRPSYVNFLGDTNVPSTGLTPEMLAQIDAMSGPPTASANAAAGSGSDRAMLAQIMARLDAMKGGRGGGGVPGPMRERRFGFGGGGGNNPGYTSSGGGRY